MERVDRHRRASSSAHATRIGLRRWYEDDARDSSRSPTATTSRAWIQREGETVFAPFDEDSEMIGPPEHTWMLNFRV